MMGCMSTSTSLDFPRLEKWLVILIAIHSVAIGLVLLFLTRWGAGLGGWPEVTPLFFARQAGIFPLVVAAGYLIEYFRYGGVTFLLVTKILAVTFLAGVMVVEPGSSWTIPISALGDGMMALVVYLVHRQASS